MSDIRIKEAGISGEERKEYVTKMFNSVARRYDFLNHFLSGGIDILWRKKAAKRLTLKPESKHLDLATGTGDFAIEIYNRFGCEVHGSDISDGMLEIGKQKITAMGKSDKIFLSLADAENIPFDENTFDSVTIGFGIRNFGDKEKALREILRVLKPSGKLVILEFSKIRTPIIGSLFDFYFKHILPKIGALFSDDKEAYTYLPDSVNTFPAQPDFVLMLSEQGFTNAGYKNLSFGISSIFWGEK